MATITIPGMFLTGDHASRPAATAVGGGSIYSCTTHSLIYQSDGATWSTWATLGETGTAAHLADTSDAHDASAISFSPTGTVASTDVQAAIAEVASEAGSGAGVVASARSKRTSGNITMNSTTWANVDTGLDLTIAAVASNVLEISLSARISNEATTAALDAASIVSGSPVNYISGGGGAADLGIAGWMGVNGAIASVGSTVQYVVQAGDISGGNVVLRLRYRTSSAVNKTLFATTDVPLHFCVANLKH